MALEAVIDTNKSAKLHQLNQINIAKKNFHAVLLKDSRLNNLKEILLEIKQKQAIIQSTTTTTTPTKRYETPPSSAFSSSTSSAASSSSSSSSSTTASSSHPHVTKSKNTNEFKEAIERLCQYVFDFLKQGLKPAQIESNIFIPPPPPPPPLPPGAATSTTTTTTTESNTLSLLYAQYTSLWNLIEQTMNHNLAHSPLQRLTSNSSTFQPQLSQQHVFSLPKESYVNMFQEINRYASTVNQKYLIDSGINTSQLRRKHHFMVLLMSLKYKFQLFISNLLNYRQLANWIEFVSKDKTLLKTYYDFAIS
jgi:hypothetical protein